MAWQSARTAGTLGPIWIGCFKSTFNTASRCGNRYRHGEEFRCSVAFAAVRSVHGQIFSDLSAVPPWLIGAGETIAWSQGTCSSKAWAVSSLPNRTLERAELLSRTLGGQAHSAQSDSRIFSPSAISFYQLHGQVSADSRARARGEGIEAAGRPQSRCSMVDMAVPRDIEPEGGWSADVYLYTVDDSARGHWDNLRSRRMPLRRRSALLIWYA